MHSCQQDELYAAEQTLPLRYMGAGFTTQKELQRYVDELRELPYWQNKFPNVLRVEAEFKPSGSGSVGGFFPEQNSGKIEMLPVHRCELFVLHEVAHVLASSRYGSAGHSPWFARTYLELVNAAMSTDVYLALYEAFEEAGIDTDIDEGATGLVVAPNGEVTL